MQMQNAFCTAADHAVRACTLIRGSTGKLRGRVLCDEPARIIRDRRVLHYCGKLNRWSADRAMVGKRGRGGYLLCGTGEVK